MASHHTSCGMNSTFRCGILSLLTVVESPEKHNDVSGCLKRQQAENRRKKREEVPVVAFANAAVQPHTVVVKANHAFIARTTVLAGCVDKALQAYSQDFSTLLS